MHPAFIHANYYAERAIAVFQPKGESILNVFSYQNTQIKGEVCNFCITTQLSSDRFPEHSPRLLLVCHINGPPLTQTLGKATFAVVWQLKQTYRYFDNITDSLCYTF